MTLMFQRLQSFMEQNQSGDTEAKQLMMELHQQFGANQTRLASKNEELQTELKHAQETWHSEKESYLIKTTRLESELDASKREAAAQVGVLKELQAKLEQQLATVRSDKEAQMTTSHTLQQEKMAVEAKLRELMAQMQSVQSQLVSERATWETQEQGMLKEKVELMKSLRSLEEDQLNLSRQSHEYEKEMAGLRDEVTNLEQRLHESDVQLREKEVKVALLEENIRQATSRISELVAETQQMQTTMDAQQAELRVLKKKGTEQADQQALELSEKDGKIGELFRQLGEKQKELQEQQNGFQMESERHAETERSWSARSNDLKSALEDAVDQLNECEKVNAGLKKKVMEMESELGKEQQKVEEEMAQRRAFEEKLRLTENEYYLAQSTVEGISKKEAELLEQLHDLKQAYMEKDSECTMIERRLKLTEQERDDARNNMQGFDEREADLYRKLQESDQIRRVLHARVMQLAGNIRVFVRVRPALPSELHTEPAAAKEASKRKRDDAEMAEQPFTFPGIYHRQGKKSSRRTTTADDLTKNVIVATEPYKDRGGLSDRRMEWQFGFDNVFSPEHGQEDVWEATEPLVQSAVDGFNVTVFAYGQTGSGKTYTMLGDEDNMGIIGRAVAMLFKAKSTEEELSRGEAVVELSVELLEIYNEQVRDLLAPNSGSNGRKSSLKVTSKEVEGNVRVHTRTEEDVMNVLKLAQSRRCVKATASNAESSRSHMLFTIHFSVAMKDGTTRSGKLNVCDLAGSERLGKSGAHIVGVGTARCKDSIVHRIHSQVVFITQGALLEETKHINTSLSALSNVIERLQAGDKTIPFRESKLTFLLQNSLGGNSKTLAIVCCSPLVSHFHESLCSLRFAEKVNRVELKAVANFSC